MNITNTMALFLFAMLTVGSSDAVGQDPDQGVAPADGVEPRIVVDSATPVDEVEPRIVVNSDTPVDGVEPRIVVNGESPVDGVEPRIVVNDDAPGEGDPDAETPVIDD